MGSAVAAHGAQSAKASLVAACGAQQLQRTGSRAQAQ